MARELIKLRDGTYVEIETTGEQVQLIAGGLAHKVQTTMDTIQPVLLKTCQPVVEAVKKLSEEIDLEQVEVEVGLSFDLEGNVFVSKANFGANLLVRMTLKKKE